MSLWWWSSLRVSPGGCSPLGADVLLGVSGFVVYVPDTVVAAGLCSKQLCRMSWVSVAPAIPPLVVAGGHANSLALSLLCPELPFWGSAEDEQWPPPSRLGGCCPAPREAGEMPKRAPGRVVVSCLRVLHGPKSSSRRSSVFRGIFACFPPCR